MYELVIIGGGPAGVAAGVYAARKRIKSLLITDAFGGQSIVSPCIENWIGEINISGLDLSKKLESHLRYWQEKGDLDIYEGDLVSKVTKEGAGFKVITKKGKLFPTKTVLVCSGSRRKRLGVPGEDKLDGKGIAWCATCDAPLFKDKAVAVIGGGNAGLEAVLTLNSYASKIYLLQHNDQLKGDAVVQEKVKQLDKVVILLNAETQEIMGEEMVSGLRYKDIKTGEEKILKVEGVFIEIGSVPNADFLDGLVETDQWGQIRVDPKTQRSSVEGIWAAGDVTNGLYKQNNISAGDAVKGLLNVFDYLHKNK